MHNKKASALMVFVVAGALALAACSRAPSGTTSKAPVAPANAFRIRVTANAGLTPWIEQAVDKFNQSGTKLAAGKPVFVDVSIVEAGQAVSDMTDGTNLPALWIPDDAVWAAVLAKRGQTGYQANCAALVAIAGVYCLVMTRNFIRVLIGLELMTKAATLLIIVAGLAAKRMALAQSLAITLIVVEVVVVSVAAGIVLSVFRLDESLDIRKSRNLKG